MNKPNKPKKRRGAMLKVERPFRRVDQLNLDYDILFEAVERYTAQEVPPEQRTALQLSMADFLDGNERRLSAALAGSVMQDMRTTHRKVLEDVLVDLHDSGGSDLYEDERNDIIRSILNREFDRLDVLRREHLRELEVQNTGFFAQLGEALLFRRWHGSPVVPVVLTILMLLGVAVILTLPIIVLSVW